MTLKNTQFQTIKEMYDEYIKRLSVTQVTWVGDSRQKPVSHSYTMYTDYYAVAFAGNEPEIVAYGESGKSAFLQLLKVMNKHYLRGYENVFGRWHEDVRENAYQLYEYIEQTNGKKPW